MGVERCRVEISEAARAKLEEWLRAQSIRHALATRTRILFGSAAHESVRALASRFGHTTVCLWRRHYRSAGPAGLQTRPRAGGRQIAPAREQAVIRATPRKPKAVTHWSAPRLASEVGLSRASVHRIWRKYGYNPFALRA
jgi:hypothetical protein